MDVLIGNDLKFMKGRMKPNNFRISERERLERGVLPLFVRSLLSITPKNSY